MTKEQAIRILSSETSMEEIHKLKYYAGFNQDRVLEQIQEAMDMGADALKNDSINRLVSCVKSQDIELSLKLEYSLHYGWIVQVIRKGYDMPIVKVNDNSFDKAIELTYSELKQLREIKMQNKNKGY